MGQLHGTKMQNKISWNKVVYITFTLSPHWYGSLLHRVIRNQILRWSSSHAARIQPFFHVAQECCTTTSLLQPERKRTWKEKDTLLPFKGINVKFPYLLRSLILLAKIYSQGHTFLQGRQENIVFLGGGHKLNYKRGKHGLLRTRSQSHLGWLSRYLSWKLVPWY